SPPSGSHLLSLSLSVVLFVCVHAVVVVLVLVVVAAVVTVVLNRDLSSAHLARLEEASFSGLSLLDELHLGNNRISFIADGAFRGLSHLQTLSFPPAPFPFIVACKWNQMCSVGPGGHRRAGVLPRDLQTNEISWTIEDMNGPFSALDKLKKLLLQGNRIRSVTKKSFSGLDSLERL
ncbi:hypothetical protein CRUP_003912, partial [Coryphaenoides rupestris]